MIGLVVVCHEDMGAELVKAAEMIVGKIEAVATVSVKQDSAPEMLRDEIEAAIKKVDRKKGVMLFTDMFGGTPSNIALAFLGDTVEVVTGRQSLDADQVRESPRRKVAARAGQARSGGGAEERRDREPDAEGERSSSS